MLSVRSSLGRQPHPPRVGVVRDELRRFRRPRYLEIGVHAGLLFLHVRAHSKVAVDPVPRIARWRWLAHPNTALRGRLLRMTSDAFFSDLDRGTRFDVVFVDGHHTREQALRDIEGGLAHLSADGVVLVHDCNPTNPAAASRDSADAAGGGWCGDVWKAIVELRATRSDLSVRTLDCDFGIGVVRRRPSTPLALEPAAIEAMTYADLERDRAHLLGLCPGD